MGNRNINIKDAEKLLSILENGEYQINGNTIQIPEYTDAKYYTHKNINELSTFVPKQNTSLDIELYSGSTVDSVIKEYKELKTRKLSGKLGVLNFASAKHPGGGFMTGAMAQEEALCHASTLYRQLEHSEMYVDNAINLGELYNDAMNVSETYFIRDGNGNMVKPIPAIVVTSAAVNVNRVRQSSVLDIRAAMKHRMEYILQMFIGYDCDTIILGAFGCGVFGNDPKFVAETWRELLDKYGGYFDKVVFAILDRNGKNMRTFKEIFK